MSAVVDELAVSDLSRVIRVGEHAVDLAVVQWRPDVLDGGAALQATFLEFVAQR
nr:hypothetical protein [Cryobacterium fucosi]